MTATMTPATSSSKDAARRMGVTYRILDYWARTGVLVSQVPASGSGSRRSYSADDVAIGRALAHLGEHGARTEVLERAALELREVLAAGEWTGPVFVDLEGHVDRELGVAAWVLHLDELDLELDAAAT